MFSRQFPLCLILLFLHLPIVHLTLALILICLGLFDHCLFLRGVIIISWVIGRSCLSADVVLAAHLEVSSSEWIFTLALEDIVSAFSKVKSVAFSVCVWITEIAKTFHNYIEIIEYKMINNVLMNIIQIICMSRFDHVKMLFNIINYIIKSLNFV